MFISTWTHIVRTKLICLHFNVNFFKVWKYFHDAIIFVWWFGWYKILWRFFFPSKFSIIFWVPVFLLRSSTTFRILMIWCDLLLFSLVYFRIPSLFWVCWNFTIMCLGSIGLSLYTGPLCSENSYPSVLAIFLLRLLMQFPLLDFFHSFFSVRFLVFSQEKLSAHPPSPPSEVLWCLQTVLILSLPSLPAPAPTQGEKCEF